MSNLAVSQSSRNASFSGRSAGAGDSAANGATGASFASNDSFMFTQASAAQACC